jgi:hypothetical protein
MCILCGDQIESGARELIVHGKVALLLSPALASGAGKVTKDSGAPGARQRAAP